MSDVAGAVGEPLSLRVCRSELIWGVCICETVVVSHRCQKRGNIAHSARHTGKAYWEGRCELELSMHYRCRVTEKKKRSHNVLHRNRKLDPDGPKILVFSMPSHKGDKNCMYFISSRSADLKRKALWAMDVQFRVSASGLEHPTPTLTPRGDRARHQPRTPCFMIQSCCYPLRAHWMQPRTSRRYWCLEKAVS